MPATAKTDRSRLVIYAPGIHTGGGFTLLRAILASDILNALPCILCLDARSLPNLTLPAHAELNPITPSLTGRLHAERSLKAMTGPDDTVLCLHSLPPLYRLRSHTVCFLQNVLHLGDLPLTDYPLKTRLRLFLERLVARTLKARVDTYLVQTDTMKDKLEQWHGAEPHVVSCPFASSLAPAADQTSTPPAIDFLYVADGLPHKNHRNLIQAWLLLANQGINPKLGLTLSPRDHLLQSLIEEQRLLHGLAIENYGTLSQAELSDLYRSSRALIFPSFTESLGLPLIEANQIGLAIIASERDYVRDVCRPVETFDPTSPKSIARAVRRFLGLDTDLQTLYSPDTFIRTALARDATHPVEMDR